MKEVVVEVIKIIGIFGGIILTAYINRKFNKLHQQINSRMDELLSAAKAAGKTEEKKEQAVRDGSDQK